MGWPHNKSDLEDFKDVRHLCWSTQVGGLKVSDLEGCLNRIKVSSLFVAVSLGRRRRRNLKKADDRRGVRFCCGKKQMEKSILLITVCLAWAQNPKPAVRFSKDKEHQSFTVLNQFPYSTR